MKRISKILVATFFILLTSLFLTACKKNKKELKALASISLPTEITQDLELPAKQGEFDLVWQSGHSDYPVEQNVLKVKTRPETNQTVTLICKINATNKDFVVTVLAKNTKLEELIAKVNPTSTITDVLGKISLPVEVEGTKVEWSEVGEKDLLVINQDTGDCELKDKTVTETVNVRVQAKIVDNGDFVTKELELIYRVTKTNDEILTEELSNVNLEFASGEDAQNVKTNISLPLPLNSGVTYNWTSSNPNAVVEDNKVNVRPDAFTEDTTVTITLVAKLNETTKTKTFEVKILKNVFTDSEKIAQIVNNTKLVFAEGETETTVKSNVGIQVPNVTASQVVTFEITNGLSIVDNVIQVPADNFATDTEITLTLKCSVNAETATKEFKFTVLKNLLTDEEKVDRVINSFQLKFKAGDNDTNVTKNVEFSYEDNPYATIKVTTNNADVTVETNTIFIPNKKFLVDTTVVITLEVKLNTVTKTTNKEIIVKQNITQAELDIQAALATLEEVYTTENDIIKVPKVINGLSVVWNTKSTKLEKTTEGENEVFKYKRAEGDNKSYNCKLTAIIEKEGHTDTRTVDAIFTYIPTDEEIVDKVLKKIPTGSKTLKPNEQSSEFPTVQDGVEISFVIISSTPKGYGVIEANKLKLSNTQITENEIVKVKFTYKKGTVEKYKEVDYTFKAPEMVTIKFDQVEGVYNASSFVDIKVKKGTKFSELTIPDPFFTDLTKKLFSKWVTVVGGKTLDLHNNFKFYNNETTLKAEWLAPLSNDEFLAANADDYLYTSAIVYNVTSKGFYAYTNAGLFFVRAISDDGQNVLPNGTIAKKGSLIWFQGLKLQPDAEREITLIKKDGSRIEEAYWGEFLDTITLPEPLTELFTNDIITSKSLNRLVKVTFNVKNILPSQDVYDLIHDETGSNIGFKLLLNNDLVQTSIDNFKAQVVDGTGLGTWELVGYTALDSENNLVVIPYKDFTIKHAYTFDQIVENILDKEVQNIVNTTIPKTTDQVVLVTSKLGITITYSDQDMKLTVDNTTATIELTDKTVTSDVIIKLVVHYEKGAETKDKNHNLKFTFVPTDEYLVEIAKNNLTLPSSLNHSTTTPAILILPNTQDGIVVTWEEIDGTLFDFTTKTLKDPNISTNTIVKLRATLAKNVATATKDFSVEFVLVADGDMVKLSQVAQDVKAGISTLVNYTESLTGLVKEKDGVTIAYSDDANLVDYETTFALINQDITSDVKVIVKMKLTLNGKVLNEQIEVTFKYIKKWTVTINLDGGESATVQATYKVTDGEALPVIDTTDIIHKTDHTKGAFLFFSQDGLTGFNMSQIITDNITLKALYQTLDSVETLSAKSNNDLVHLRGLIVKLEGQNILLRDVTGLVVVKCPGRDLTAFVENNEVILTANVNKIANEAMTVTVASTNYFMKANDSYPGFTPVSPTEITDQANLSDTNYNKEIKLTYNHTAVFTEEQVNAQTLTVLDDAKLNIVNSNNGLKVLSDTEYNAFWNGLKEPTSIGQYTFTLLYLISGETHVGYITSTTFSSKTELPNNVKVEFVKNSLTLPAEVEADYALELKTKIDNYDDVSIVWSETTVPALLDLTTGKLLDSNITEPKTVNLKATISKDGETAEKTFSVVFKAVPNTLTKTYMFNIAEKTFGKDAQVENDLQMDDLFTAKNHNGKTANKLHKSKDLRIYQNGSIDFVFKDTTKKIVSIELEASNGSKGTTAISVNGTELSDKVNIKPSSTHKWIINNNSFTIKCTGGKCFYLKIVIEYEK